MTAWLLLSCGLLSGLVNNTSLMALMIPLASELAHQQRRDPAEILLPLNYVVVAGGTLTLMGTSSTLIAAALASERGMPPIGFLEPARLGLPLLLVTVLFASWVQRRWQGRAQLSPLDTKYELASYLAELRVTPASGIVGETVLSQRLAHRSGVTVLQIIRRGGPVTYELRSTPIEPGDILLVKGKTRDILMLEQREGLELVTSGAVVAQDLTTESAGLAEVQVTPMSEFEGATLEELNLRQRFGVFVLAISRAGEIIRERLSRVRFKRYDTLLVYGAKHRIERLVAATDLLPLRELDLHVRLPRRWWIAALGLPLVALNVLLFHLPFILAALGSLALLFLTRAASPQRLYRRVDWSVFLLLALSLPLGTLFERSGGAQWVSSRIVELAQNQPSWVTIALLYGVTVLLSELLSNAATVVLMLPVAFAAAESLGVEALPLVFAVIFGASLAFASPVGYQTHAMVYAAGGYRLRELFVLGLLLDVLLGVVVVLLIPLFWPVAPTGVSGSLP
jgi:di/tricarboxylate transporter